ncbi:Outer membrane efflux protein [Candidatus Sulfopaludibacter sp. SbA6]|nr:Outer membrane efflux protein [Candidatus Sulfopaludibacter sp. SbA6]
MSFAKSFLAILLCCAIALPGFAQTPELSGGNHHFFSWITNNYVGHPLPRVAFEDSPRLEKLMRAGTIYLSLRDAIALALENNLDLEYARYNPKLAEANLLRVSAGALLRNISSSITSGPSSATLGVLAGTQLGSGGTSGNSGGGSGQGGVLSGLNVQLQGTAVPNLDPVLFVSGTFTHNTTIETATNITGTNFLVSQYKSYVYGAQEGFLTGTQVTAYMSNTIGVTQNSPFNMFNPYSQATLNLSVSQNLLQGFRPSINNRYIRVAKNSLRISDLTFKNQVMATLVSVVSLYWDLVSDIEAFKVNQQTLDLNTRQYNDNKRKAELGAIAPIDIIQAEAEMKASQQDVTTSRAQVLNQETILKNYLTRGAMDNLAVVEAHIVPTDHFDVPEQEIVRPIQDLITEAITNRPDVEQSQIALENSRITTLGVKDAMLPVLAVTASTSNGGLAGQLNTVPGPGGVPEYTSGTANQYFQGGYGNVLGQIFGRNFPNYSAGISLTMTLRNRSTQADLITDQLNYRQQQIQDRQLHNNIKQNVVNARTSLEQARSAYETAVEARKLQEQVLQGSRRKYELGTATILDVIIAQRDATTRELSEVNARNQYIHARINLENVLGTVLREHDVNIDDAKTGIVGRPPDLIPAVPPGGPAAAPARQVQVQH